MRSEQATFVAVGDGVGVIVGVEVGEGVGARVTVGRAVGPAGGGSVGMGLLVATGDGTSMVAVAVTSAVACEVSTGSDGLQPTKKEKAKRVKAICHLPNVLKK